MIEGVAFLSSFFKLADLPLLTGLLNRVITFGLLLNASRADTFLVAVSVFALIVSAFSF